MVEWRSGNYSRKDEYRNGGKTMRKLYVLAVLIAFLCSLVSSVRFSDGFDADEEELEKQDVLKKFIDSQRSYQNDDFQRSESDELLDWLRDLIMKDQYSQAKHDGEYDNTERYKEHDHPAEESEEEMFSDSDESLLDQILAHFEIDIVDNIDGKKSNAAKVSKFLKTYQKELSEWRKKSGLTEWIKETNLTSYNIEIAKKSSLEMSAWAKKRRLEADKFSTNGLNYEQKRMLRFVTDTDALMEPYLNKKEVNLESKISEIYSKAEVCNSTSGKCYHFEPGLIKLMETSRDYDELRWAWKGWRDAIGPKIRKDWIAAMEVSNKGAREHGYHDVGEYRRHQYEDPDFEKDIDDLWKKLEPIYKEVHAYVRYKLHQKYGDRVALDKPIPAHLLGDMWAMKWDGIFDILSPFADVEPFDVTKEMKDKNMTVMDMFHLADHFYRSLGLPKMTPEFWKNSMFTRPKDNRSVVCYASAHNLERDDVRIKMCATVSGEYLYVVHHEMGHCQYYLAYNRHQPSLFQSGANHGFHEAIGDTAALSVISPTHLEKLKLLKYSTGTALERKKRDINFLMKKALGKLVFYPFALTMAKWYWNVYSGKIKQENINDAWWQYRKQYQGLVPPVDRTEQDFDPGCKYHIANFVPYVRYFVSHVLQFQFFEALCDLAKFKGPLFKCDFAGSLAAGEKFKKMLEMGDSKPWPQALKELTGTTKMSVDSVEKYFHPLITWLKAENKRLNNKIGWN
uniref:angiotensin-converting enzyme-like n=1 Tax=Styela clava TaxID=7725 RepID=UPI00193962DC|nr:angiotensin-converting enzyme-like [Styela clava]